MELISCGQNKNIPDNTVSHLQPCTMSTRRPVYSGNIHRNQSKYLKNKHMQGYLTPCVHQCKINFISESLQKNDLRPVFKQQQTNICSFVYFPI